MTLSMVLPIIHFLQAELLPAAGDKAAVRTLKSGLQEQLSTRFKLKDHALSSLLVLAAVLDPRFRDTFLSDNEKKKLPAILTDLCTPKEEDARNKEASQEPAAEKKAAIDRRPSLLSRLSKAVEVATSSLDEEAGTYVSGAPCETTTDPLQWWKTNETSFPHLAMLAKRYLAVPATSTKSERAYSAAGIIAGKRRESLLSENVDRLILLN